MIDDDRWLAKIRNCVIMGHSFSPFVFLLKSRLTFIVYGCLMGIAFICWEAVFNHSSCDTKRRGLYPMDHMWTHSSSSLLMIYSITGNTQTPAAHISIMGFGWTCSSQILAWENCCQLMSQNNITFALLGFWIILFISLIFIATIQMRILVWWWQNTNSIDSRGKS